MYREFFKAVRLRNEGLPQSDRLRVIACDPPIDWPRVKSTADAAPFLDRTGHCSSVIEREVLEKGRRALLIMGDAHIGRRGVSGNVPRNVVNVIESRWPSSVYVVLPYLGQFSENATIEARIPTRPSLVPTSTEWLSSLTATPPAAPTRTRLGPGQSSSETILIVKPPRFPEVADALLYVGPRAQLTRSVPPANQWNPEELVELERRHQILFGTPLDRSLLFK